MRRDPSGFLLASANAHGDVVRLRLGPMLAHLVINPDDVMHDPEAFLPDRFEPGGPADQQRFAFFPFGGGPHQCIGNMFAMMEAVIMLATVLRRVRLEAVPTHRIDVEPSVTLRPRHGLSMRMPLRRRAPNLSIASAS